MPHPITCGLSEALKKQSIGVVDTSDGIGCDLPDIRCSNLGYDKIPLLEDVCYWTRPYWIVGLNYWVTSC